MTEATLESITVNKPSRKRWIWVCLALTFILTLLACTLPFVQNYYAIKKAESLGCVVFVRNGWLIDALPLSWQQSLVEPGNDRLLLALQEPWGVVLFNNESSIGDIDLSCLNDFPKLEMLTIIAMQATDEDLRNLNQLDHLTSLSLYGALITDKGLTYLNGISSLEGLQLTGTQVTDAGLINLKEMAKLEDLDLNQTQITDAGLIHLKGLVNLKTLDLTETKVTTKGVEELRKALPDCRITR